MKKISPKILKILFLILLCLQLAGFAYFLIKPVAVSAADPTTFTSQVGIPNSPFEKGKIFTFNTKDTRPIGELVQAIYKYAIGVVGILATVVLMIGGIVWITAGGAPERVGEAKAWIGASLTGLTLTLASYMMLAMINPALTSFNINKIQQATYNAGLNGCSQEQGICYDTCPENWTERPITNNECGTQKCCVRYAGACQTPPPNGLGGSCRSTASGCNAGEVENKNGYCGGDTSIAICCVPNK